MPYMSIIIPAYNEEKLIGRLLESINKARNYLYQKTKEKVELIVVNNHCSDHTDEIAKRYGAKIICHTVHNISQVRNTGFSYSNGEVVIFLDADNIITENALYEIYKTMKSGKYVGGGMKFKWDKNNLIYNMVAFCATIFSKIIGVTGVMIYTYRQVFQDIGGFNEHFFCGEDLLFVRMLKKYGRKKHLKYKNIYNATVTTSARRLNKMTVKDLIHFLKILLRPSLMKIQKNCESWYSIKKR